MLGTGLAIAGALVALVTWRWRPDSAEGELTTAEQLIQAVDERRSGVRRQRIGAALGLVAIGLLTAVVFLAPKLDETAHDNVPGLVAYNFEQGISTDAQANRYVTDVTGHGHIGYLKTGQTGDLTVIDHPGQGNAVHFPAPCTSTPTTTCALALIQPARADDLNPGTRDFSYGADVLITSTETRRHASIMQKGPVPNPGGQWKLQIEDTAGRPSCVITGKGSLRGDIFRAVATASVADGNWHKVQCVKTATVLLGLHQPGPCELACRARHQK